MRSLTWSPIVMVVLLGCGGGDDGPPAGDPDGGADARGGDPDSGPPDATVPAAATVTVTSLDGLATPVAGADVVFVDAEGTAILQTTTDEAGQASTDVLPGTTVTVVRRRADGVDVTTVVDVGPGDQLRLGRAAAAPPGPVGQMTIDFTPRDGALEYVLYRTCGIAFPAADASSVTVDFSGACAATTFDYVLVATGRDGQPAAFAHADDQPFVDDGTVTIPDNWAATATFDLAYQAIGDVVYASAGRILLADGFAIANLGRSGPVAGAEHAVSFKTPSYGAQAAISIYLLRDNTQPPQTAYQRGAPGSSLTFDGAATLLPWVGDIALAPATATLTWTTTGHAEATYDGLIAHVSYSRGEGDDAQTSTWRVIAPPSPTSTIVLPTLPAELGDIGPHAGDVTTAGLLLVDADYPDYAAFRAGIDLEADGLERGDESSPFTDYIFSGQLYPRRR